MSAFKNVTRKELEEAVKAVFSITQALNQLGIKMWGGNVQTFKKRVAQWDISTSHFTGKAHDGKRIRGYATKLIPLREILVKDSHYSRYNLKRRLLKGGFLENECAICGLAGKWQGKPIVMVLDHINGANNDNRLKNLRLLCPNCNSQQPTFSRGSGKQRSKEYLCSVCGKSITRQSKSGKCVKCVKL